jgi:hypothetical protein
MKRSEMLKTIEEAIAASDPTRHWFEEAKNVLKAVEKAGMKPPGHHIYYYSWEPEDEGYQRQG